MNYTYIQVSTDKQATKILKFADEKKLSIDSWQEETVNVTRKVIGRKLGELF